MKAKQPIRFEFGHTIGLIHGKPARKPWSLILLTPWNAWELAAWRTKRQAEQGYRKVRSAMARLDQHVPLGAAIAGPIRDFVMAVVGPDARPDE